ncbi:hypothetical protein HK101_009872 [Irineochytrium annulatum]|nr:hypothetical protein HK101_009872 [Irineochytrium annulatum]
MGEEILLGLLKNWKFKGWASLTAGGEGFKSCMAAVTTDEVVPFDSKQQRPIDKRSCHDIIFLVVFAVFWAGMVVVARWLQFAFRYGDPSLLLDGQDSFGNYCGGRALNVSTGVNTTLLPYAYYFNPLEPWIDSAVCVSSCPTTTDPTTPNNAICVYNHTTTWETLLQDIVDGTCAPFIFASEPIFNRCVPIDPIPANVSREILNFALNISVEGVSAGSLVTSTSSIAQNVFADVEKTKWYILGSAGVAVFLTLVWLLLLRAIAKTMVWATIVIIDLMFAGAAVALYFYSQSQKQVYLYGTSPGHDSWTQKTIYESCLYSSYCFAGIFVLMVILTLAMARRIKIAIVIIEETAKAVGKMPFIMFFPLFIWLAVVLLFAYFAVVALYCMTMHTDASLVVLGHTLDDNNLQIYLTLYHTFGFLWGFNFLLGINCVTLAGGFATYYWTMDKHHIRPMPVTRSFLRACTYHLGSIALGSIAIAVVQIMRISLWVAVRKVKRSRIKCLACLLKCCDTCLGCLTKVVKWINKNAYIKIAIDGKSFCASCGSAFALIIRNALKLATVDMVADFVLAMSKICITAMTVAIFYGLFWWQQNNLSLSYIFVPLILIGLICYIITIGMLGVYHMGIDTIFLCFLEDSERNDGSVDKPYFMPDSLKPVTNASPTLKTPVRKHQELRGSIGLQ